MQEEMEALQGGLPKDSTAQVLRLVPSLLGAVLDLGPPFFYVFVLGQEKAFAGVEGQSAGLDSWCTCGSAVRKGHRQRVVERSTWWIVWIPTHLLAH